MNTILFLGLWNTFSPVKVTSLASENGLFLMTLGIAIPLCLKTERCRPAA